MIKVQSNENWTTNQINAGLFASVFRNDGDFLQVGQLLYDLRPNKPTSGTVVGRDVYPRIGLKEPDVSFTKDRKFYAKENVIYNQEDEPVYDVPRSEPFRMFISKDDKLHIISHGNVMVIDWRFNEVDAVYSRVGGPHYSSLYFTKSNKFIYYVPSPDGRLCTAPIRMVNSDTLQDNVIIDILPYTVVDQSKDGRKAIITIENKIYKLLDTQTKKITDFVSLPLPPPDKGFARSIKSSFSNDGKYVIILPDTIAQATNILHIYDTETGQLHATLEQPPKVFNAMFRWDDKIITVYEGGQIGYWDFEKAELIGHTRLRAY
jgi:transposase